MTYFFAFEVPDKARFQIAEFAERWQRQVDPVLNAKWVAPDNYHITLKYLGDISPERVEAPMKAVTPLMGGVIFRSYITPLLFEQKPMVVFPLGKPSVLWIEIIPTSELQSLAWQMEVVQSGNGVNRDHRLYNPHITVAHCKPDAESRPLTLSEQAFDPFAVSRFVLMQTLPPESRAKDSKARYNIVQTFPFGGSPEATQHGTQGEMIG